MERSYALVSLDADLYQPTMAGLAYFYPRLSPGGYMILDDYNSPQFPGAGQAVREFCAREGLAVVPLCDIHGTAVLAKPVSYTHLDVYKRQVSWQARIPDM